MKKRNRTVLGLNSAELEVHSPEWAPIRLNGAPIGFSSKSLADFHGVCSHSPESKCGLPESMPIRPSGASIWPNGYLHGLFSSFEALDAFQTLGGP